MPISFNGKNILAISENIRQHLVTPAPEIQQRDLIQRHLSGLGFGSSGRIRPCFPLCSPDSMQA
jgi:hypothetical protein